MANPGQSISFNSNSLQTTQILTADIDHASTPEIDAKIYSMAHASATAIAFIDYPKKVIPVSGELIGTSISNLDGLLDTFKGYLTAKNANLDIGYNGGTRRYNGSVTKAVIQRPRNLTYAKFNVEFTCQPFGMDTTATSLISHSGFTSASSTDTPTLGGTAPYQYVTATMTYTAISGGTGATVSFGNNNTGQQVNITRNWTTGDVLVIDMTQLFNTSGTSVPVMVNNLPVVFTGALPIFPVGASSMQYTDSFTTRTVTYTVTNTNRYM